MDPKETLISAAALLDCAEWDEAAELLGAYRQWRAMGRFEPEVFGTKGDELVCRLGRKLQRRSSK